MPDSLQDLESRRADLVKRIAGLRDLRSGSISDTSGRCHQPCNPVHGPNPRLTYKDRGKTVTESLPTPAAQKRPSAKLRSFAASSNSFARSLTSTPRSAALERRRKNRHLRKKNDGSGLRKSLQPIRAAVAKDFRRPAQDRPTGS